MIKKYALEIQNDNFLEILSVRPGKAVWPIQTDSGWIGVLGGFNVLKGPLILRCQMISVECPTNFEIGAIFSIVF